ncbi:cytochrome c oxidase subunit 3 [Albibacterium indicum]|uniref:cytochrome c oxidase subunit 3 n=1 Tax=Albibacterium indicum TaxID=2292082 RepID=UPI000E5026CC|nr:cytochrome c oxidase subunit 3 [Pedobacter indicus]
MSTTVSKLDEVKTGKWSGGTSPLKAEYGKVMMWLFLLSDAFTFTGFLTIYGAQRMYMQDTWPNPDIIFQSIPFITDTGAPLVFVGIMTFILIVSSVTMVLAVEAGHRHSKKEVVIWMILTIVGGLTFLGCQALEWSHLSHQGFWFGAIPESIPLAEQQGATQFSSFFFAITGFHGFHVTVGITLNIIILLMTLANVFERRGTYLMIEKVGLYWHFVDLVWVFVFTFFYLV